MNKIIEIKNLEKVYKKKIGLPGLFNNSFSVVKEEIRAVHDINLDVFEGEFFGLLGPNGAGKTTTILMLITLLEKTNGSASVCGFDIKKQAHQVRENIGYVSQETIIDENLTAVENLQMVATFYNQKKADIKKRMEYLLEITDLKDRKNDLVRTFSGGMKRKLEIVSAVLHQPRVLFIDEPTIGLDPKYRRVIWNYLKDLVNELKITIFLTTHYLDEADALCDRIAIIDKGEIRVTGVPVHLKNELGTGSLVIETVSGGGDFKSIQDLKFVSKVALKDNELTILTDNPEKRIADIVLKLRDMGIGIVKTSIKCPTLDDVFFHHTGHNFNTENN